MSKTAQRHISYFSLGVRDAKEGKAFSRRVPHSFVEDYKKGVEHWKELKAKQI